jgi:hypothetical protein
MDLDIRFPIGLLFTILGALLVVYGALSDTAIYARSLGLNINVWWGLAMLVFGLLMAFFGRRAMMRPSPIVVPTGDAPYRAHH